MSIWMRYPREHPCQLLRFKHNRLLSIRQTLLRLAVRGFVTCLLLQGAGCATNPGSPPPSLAASVEKADAAYRNLPTSLPLYNLTVREICAAMEMETPTQFVSSLQKMGIAFDSPKIELPLRGVELATPPLASKEPRAGIPMVLEYETKNAPLYPPEGLFVDATAIYDRTSGRPRFSILSKESDVKLNGRSYGLAANHTAAGDHLKLRAKRLARSGFASMIRPFAALRKPQIYLLDPYDRNKIPLLMVHGLQSTPVAFAALVNALRNDPEIRAKYQVWQFYYASGTPVLLNALELRSSLNQTLRRRNPRVVRVIFMAAPHRGSPMADSFIGLMGNSLTRLDPMLEYGFNRLARENPGAMTPKAAAFYKRGRFSGVRTLSPKSSALIALSELPIEVPYLELRSSNPSTRQHH